MDEAPIDLKEIMSFIRRRFWFLLLGILVGAELGYLVTVKVIPVQKAITEVMITRSRQNQTSDFTSYLSDQELAQTYVQLLTTKNVLDLTSQRLGYKIDSKDITVKVIPNTQIITIEVKNRDSQLAILIANSLVKVLIDQNGILQSGTYTSMEESLLAQKTEIETNIQSLQNQIQQASTQSLEQQKSWLEGQISTLANERANLQQEIAKLGNSDSLLLDQKNTRLDEVQSLLALYQKNYNDLLLQLGNPSQVSASSQNAQLTLLTTSLTLYQQFYMTVQSDLETTRLARMQNTPDVVQIEPAYVLDSGPMLNTIVGGFAGFVLITGIIIIHELLDDTLQTPKAIEQALGVPVLGFVADMQYKGKNLEEVYVVQRPVSPISEAFRSLGINIELASKQKPIHTILVTSPEPSDGKTTVAVNLAAVLAKGKKRVALLDADLRHPQLHNVLGLTNHIGLNDLFHNQAKVQTVSHMKIELRNLMIITSGSIAPNPVELLESDRMSHILDELQALVDIVVIDSPPSLLTDVQILASKVDAVLLVIHPGVTHAEAARSSMEMFKRSNVNVLGVVMNRIPRNRSNYYGGYKYFSDVRLNNGDSTRNEADLEVKTNSSNSEITVPSSRLARLIDSKDVLPSDPSKH